jgi:hypothetical protein
MSTCFFSLYYKLWSHLWSHKKKKVLKFIQNLFIFKLPDQGSNLDSSDSESDVLPITPSGNFGAKIAKHQA